MDDREQKIRDVGAAMHTAARDAGCLIPEGNAPLVKAMARAAVDVLDPIKRIELNGGFHAEPAPANPQRYNLFKDGNHHTHIIGNLSKEAVEAWALAVGRIR